MLRCLACFWADLPLMFGTKANAWGRAWCPHALKRCVRRSNDIAAMAVLVDAKDDKAAQFYEHFGFQRFADRSLSLFMTMRELRRTLR